MLIEWGDRVAQIVSCMDCLHYCQENMHLTPHNLGGMIMGELDWLGELHRLLYDFERD